MTPLHTTDSSVFALSDTGIPYGRKRKYSTGDAIGETVTHIEFNQVNFQRAVFRKTHDSLRGDMILQAPAKSVDDYRSKVTIVAPGDPTNQS